ncbi:MAG: hypothetical protein CMB97_00120 [Flavobacteriaceae bacterium]|nr:hypothetical protein [Flavobacteriaceae bacterium]
MNGYRQKIYKKYASCFKNSDTVFNEVKARRWGCLYKSYLRRWLPENKNSSILDVACGGGNLLFSLKNSGYNNITGVDISPEQIQLSKQVIENVVEADVLDFIKNSDNKYELIIGLDFIEHLNKNEILDFLEYAYQLLKPGGRIILQTINAQSPFGLNIFAGDLTHQTFFTPCLLENLLKLHGFENIQVRPAGPVVHGLVSLIRFGIWKCLSLILKIWNFVETGGCDSPVFTRVFLISACKNEE